MLLTLKNIWRRGIKELWSLWRDPVMLILIVYTFTASVYTAASAMPAQIDPMTSRSRASCDISW